MQMSSWNWHIIKYGRVFVAHISSDWLDFFLLLYIYNSTWSIGNNPYQLYFTSKFSCNVIGVYLLLHSDVLQHYTLMHNPSPQTAQLYRIEFIERVSMCFMAVIFSHSRFKMNTVTLYISRYFKAIDNCTDR